jgi:hypothetical protein
MPLIVSFLIACAFIVGILYVLSIVFGAMALPANVTRLLLILCGCVGLYYLYEHFGRSVGL